jgi:hypothetical protein
MQGKKRKKRNKKKSKKDEARSALSQNPDLTTPRRTRRGGD